MAGQRWLLLVAFSATLSATILLRLPRGDWVGTCRVSCCSTHVAPDRKWRALATWRLGRRAVMWSQLATAWTGRVKIFVNI